MENCIAVLSGADIARLCDGPAPMISPYQAGYRNEYGVSGGGDLQGYCIHLGDLWVTNNAPYISTRNVLAAKEYDKEIRSPSFILKPGHMVLAVSRERFCIPKNVMGLSFGKSTWARRGLTTDITPLEPGWEGYLTIEVSNKSFADIEIFEDTPITQLVFFWVRDNGGYNGAYQNQIARPVGALGMPHG